MHLPRVNSTSSGEARCRSQRNSSILGVHQWSTMQELGWRPCYSLPSILTIAVRADDWPQWRGPNRDGVWSETGILETFPPDGLKIRWRASVGIGFSSPVVADGRVYVTDSELAKPKARERVHAFDALSGKQLWSYAYDVNYPETAFDEKYPHGPISTPIVADGRIYTWGHAGILFCLDALKGRRGLAEGRPEGISQ